jgi:DNA-binding protein HU-beta
MNKSELIQAVAEAVELPKATASKAIDATIENIKQALSVGDTVTLIGFGTFSVRERAARTGRNPRTGESIDIDAANVPVFKPGKALKEAVNNNED